MSFTIALIAPEANLVGRGAGVPNFGSSEMPRNFEHVLSDVRTFRSSLAQCEGRGHVVSFNQTGVFGCYHAQITNEALSEMANTGAVRPMPCEGNAQLPHESLINHPQFVRETAAGPAVNRSSLKQGLTDKFPFLPKTEPNLAPNVKNVEVFPSARLTGGTSPVEHNHGILDRRFIGLREGQKTTFIRVLLDCEASVRALRVCVAGVPDEDRAHLLNAIRLVEQELIESFDRISINGRLHRRIEGIEDHAD